MPRKSKNNENISNEDVVITEENFNDEEVLEVKKEKTSFFSNLFKKKNKENKTNEPQTYKKPFAQRVKSSLKLFISFGLTIVLSALVSILIFYVIEKNNEKKANEEREAYLETVYQIGDIDVPSFGYLFNVNPIDITDYKSVNVENPTELITYKFEYDNAETRDANLATYVAKLKTDNFVITTTSISKSYNEGKTIVNVSYETYESGEIFTIELKFTRNL